MGLRVFRNYFIEFFLFSFKVSFIVFIFIEEGEVLRD